MRECGGCGTCGPDGKELAGWFSEGSGAALLAWDMSDGKLVVEHRFKEDPLRGLFLSGYQGRPLEWFADRSGWLLRGAAVFDRDSGGPVWVEPRDPRLSCRGPRRFVDADRMLDLIGGRESWVLRLVPIPKEKIAEARKLVDLSPEGELGLFSIEREKDRLDVFRFADGRHVVGFRPYKEAGHLGRKVRWSAFVDESHVLTCSIPGRLVLWSLPECRAVYCVELGFTPFTALDAGRKTLVVSVGRQLYLLDPAEGTVRGMLPGVEAKSGLALSAIDFREDGTRLAGLYYRDEGSILAVWDLTSGSLDSQLPLPFHGFGLSWSGPQHVLIHRTAPTGSLDEKPSDMLLSDYIRLQKWKRIVRWLRELDIPRPIYHPSVYRGLGESKLSASGAKVIRAPAKSHRRSPRTT